MNTRASDKPVGVFDSGVGGLTVLRALLERMPAERYVYLGDTARLPYGTKSRESIIRYALQSTRHLLDQGIKLLVVACNTASAAALPTLEEACPVPVVGVIRPGARAACALPGAGRLAVIATESTVQHGAYQRAILELCPAMQVEAQACSLFVALAEEGWTDGPLVEGIAARYLEPLFARFAPHRPDSLVLGCTHFPVLAGAITAVAGPDVAIIDSAQTTASEVEALLNARDLRRQAASGAVRFLATDGRERFARVGSIFLGRTLPASEVTLVDI